MDIRLRLLTAEIAILTAIASLFATNTEEWTKVYERRLFCEMQLNLWRGVNEQKTVEEIQTGFNPIPARSEGTEEAPLVLVGEVVNEPPTTNENPSEGTEGAAVDVPGEQPVTSPENQTANPSTQQVDVRPDPVGVGITGTPLYAVDGEQLDPGVAEYLYQKLCAAGIGWFYEYALCLAYQESSFNFTAVNPNMRDYGLFQFRIEFHPTLDWSNPYAQTDLFVSMMAARAAAGCDVYSMISRHNTSDYCPEINVTYLTQVLSHLPTLQRIR